MKPLVRTEHLDLASVEDIAAMKMIAIVQRGSQRDFVDVYFLLRKYPLQTLLRVTEKKYREYNRYLILRALTYFEEAERDKSRGSLQLLEKVRWNEVKTEIVQAVDRYRREHLSR